ncbi:DUF2065 family protein [Chitinasiproducens palmae]|uniref:DUF2065 domain-containing protein n=1 Tax=Chitinasiproducens palmae TaxID=1770053 RepID=A0A1H2PVU1_9BURK|nr:DUF2065 family protein [Chitinasiproducens palmae]SDV51409.1 hypothetical protein SAMN05216551_11716 [Chitinasiproducens palmae]
MPSFWLTLGLAFGLMLILEGIFPFAAPAAWKAAFSRLAELSVGQIRAAGLVALLVGLLMFMAVFWLH